MHDEEFQFHPYRQQWRKNLKLHINIDVTTLNRPAEYTQGIIDSLEAGKPFIIYSDEEHFLLAIPQFRIVICFVGGVVQTKELLADNDRYVNRIKMGMVVYDKFSTVDDFYRNFPAIENVYLLSKK
jgi:hypothetical protein